MYFVRLNIWFLPKEMVRTPQNIPANDAPCSMIENEANFLVDIWIRICQGSFDTKKYEKLNKGIFSRVFSVVTNLVG